MTQFSVWMIKLALWCQNAIISNVTATLLNCFHIYLYEKSLESLEFILILAEGYFSIL